jgi:hypothetical protein
LSSRTEEVNYSRRFPSIPENGGEWISCYGCKGETEKLAKSPAFAGLQGYFVGAYISRVRIQRYAAVDGTERSVFEVIASEVELMEN